MPVINLREQRKSFLAGVEQNGLWLGGAKVWAKPSSAPAYASWGGPGWFDASDGATVTQDAGFVSGLLNKRPSGGDLFRAGTADRLSLVANARNGRSAIRLVRDTGGRPRLAAVPTAPLSQVFQGDDRPYTAITVYMPNDTNTGYIWTASATISETTSQQIALIRRTATSSIRRQLAEGSANDVNFAGQAANAARIVAVQHTGTSISVWDNSTTKAVSGVTQNTGAFSTDLDFALFASRTLGPPGAYASVQCSLDFYEIVIENTARSDAEIVQAMQDLATKWGITLS